jgi:hypothetical protein
MSEQNGGASQRCGAEHDLQGAEAEYQSAHGPQSRQRQFQTDHEQQQHDAELGDRFDRTRCADRDRRQPRQICDERGKAERPNDDADEDEAERRADVQAVEQRDDDASRSEDDESLFVKGGIERSGFNQESLSI